MRISLAPYAAVLPEALGFVHCAVGAGKEGFGRFPAVELHRSEAHRRLHFDTIHIMFLEPSSLASTFSSFRAQKPRATRTPSFRKW
jgi:hypothetical protein